jgi:hypothetical protein
MMNATKPGGSPPNLNEVGASVADTVATGTIMSDD